MTNDHDGAIMMTAETAMRKRTSHDRARIDARDSRVTPEAALDAAASWAAVSERDPSQDGRLFYGVRTTGVYCRPSCPSRRPKRENVQFFSRVAEAEAAGFRACKRCRPDGPRPRTMDDRVEAARAWIEAHADEVVTLGSLARRLGVSPFHLQRQFSQRFGVSPSAYGRAVRIGRFKAALKAGVGVTAATYEAGFGSSRAAYEGSAKALGMSPAAYRTGGRGVEVRFATIQSAHGRALVAETARGVCAVFLGADDSELEGLLEEEFPAANRTRVVAGALRHRSAVIGVMAGDTSELPPIDVWGTPFQTRVWRALQAIPRGATRSYAEVAKAVGKPAAVRAVANACAANRVAMLIPCHRVVSSGGTSGGYRWGAARKRALLLEERLSRGEGE